MNNFKKNLEINKDIISSKVPIRRKLTFAVGMFGTQIYNASQSASTAWFWLNIMSLDNVAYSIIMLVFYNIWNALNDPIFGWISDNTRTRWGRRIPWMRLFSPIWFVSNVLLFMPLVDTEVGLIIWFCIFILLFDGCYTMVAGCYNSLLGEISYDTKERTSINTIAMVFGLFGNVIAFIAPLLFKENVFQFQTFIVLASLSGLIALSIPSLFIKERPIPPEETPLGLWKALKESVNNRPFMAFCGWNFAVQFTTSIIISNIVFYATFVLNITGLEATLLLVLFIATTLPGFIIFSRAQSKHGLKKVIFVATIIMAVGFLGLVFTMEYWQTLIALGVAGFGTAATMIFPNVMIVEGSDFDELKTNRRREAMFFGTNALLTKPAIGVAQAVLSMTLLITAFVPDDINPITGNIIHHMQSASAILGIRFIMGLFPFLMLILLGLFSLHFYPTLQEINEMKQKLQELHLKKYMVN